MRQPLWSETQTRPARATHLVRSQHHNRALNNHGSGAILVRIPRHGNIIPQEDSRTNSKEMKELLGYMARHHENLEKSFTDEQKEIFEKFHDCRSEYMSLAEAAIFEYALKLGMQIAIETLIK